MTLVVNGRFLRAAPTGLHRSARALLDAARTAGLPAQVWAPVGIADPRVDRVLRGGGSRGRDHVWEQLTLPSAARRHPLLSLANTAPLAHPHQAVWVHDLAPLVGPSWFVPAMRGYVRLVLAAARRARVVLTVSRQVAAELAAVGVPAGRVRVIRPAVDPRFVPATAEEVAAVRERLGLRSAYLLVVGWADPRKDVATALAAHRLARRQEPHTLVLAGLAHPVFAPVPRPDDLDVVLAGYLDDGALRAVLTGAAALVYPSRYEGFGLPPLEAWACGTPALVADVPALRESTEGRAPAYLPVGDAAAWAAAMVVALRGELAAPSPPAWTWADAAGELLAALRGL